MRSVHLVGQDEGCPEPSHQGLRAIALDRKAAAFLRSFEGERPPIAGITLPGMPPGSPGMSGMKEVPFVVYAVTKDGAKPTVYAEE